MGSSAFGLIQSVSAVGALAGGLTLASMGRVPRKGRVMLAAGLTYGLVVMALGGLPWPIAAFGLVIIGGACQTIFRAANSSTLLEITPANLRGRIVSLTFLDMGVQSLAAILAGTVTDAWGVAVGFAVIGGACVVIVGFIGLTVPAVRRL